MVHVQPISGGVSCRVPFIPAVEVTTPFVFASVPTAAVDVQPDGLTLEQPVNESALSLVVTATATPLPPVLVLVRPSDDELHVNVGLIAPPDVVMARIVDGARCVVNVESLG
jgi:hypothetical protein